MFLHFFSVTRKFAIKLMSLISLIGYVKGSNLCINDKRKKMTGLIFSRNTQQHNDNHTVEQSSQGIFNLRFPVIASRDCLIIRALKKRLNIH